MKDSKVFARVSFSNDVLSIIAKSKSDAKSYQLLYHCTTTENFISIMKSREFWLSNLNKSNDKNETERIQNDEYKNSFFIASFTYLDNIGEAEWMEYSSMEDGILFSVNPDWFDRNATLMDGTDKLNIPLYDNTDTAIDKIQLFSQYAKMEEIVVYCISGFDFCKVIYNDKLSLAIQQEAKLITNNGANSMCSGNIVVPGAAGIIKNEKGLCSRPGKDPYIKCWESENEVRLKIRIQQNLSDFGIFPTPNKYLLFDKVAVALNERAFDYCKIRFSPLYPSDRKCSIIKQIKEISPSTVFEVV